MLTLNPDQLAWQFASSLHFQSECPPHPAMQGDNYESQPESRPRSYWPYWRTNDECETYSFTPDPVALALTARVAKRWGPPRRAFASFFQTEIALKKKEGAKCQKDNTPLGENYCRRRSKKPGRMLEAYNKSLLTVASHE